MTSAAETCADLRDKPTIGTDITNTIHSFLAYEGTAPAPQTQTGANYSVFSNRPVGYYYLNPQPPTAGGWVQSLACWNVNLVTFGTTLSTNLVNAGDTLTWDVGYLPSFAWAQAQEGDVYTSSLLCSLILSTTSPRYLNLRSTSNSSGVSFIGADYDFDANAGISSALLLGNDNSVV